jgi:hypothetical protein
MRATGFLLISLLAVPTTVGQETPVDAPHDMEHMQHGGEHGGFMQGGMHHAVAKGVTLQTKVGAVAHTITLREGPINLPANTSHMKMPQPPDLHWTIPMNAWLLAYSPRLVDANGNEVPGRLLHHTAFWNENRADFLCPNKEEHIFGAGSEMTNWIQIPGYGYRVQKGDKIRIETMMHNLTGTSYENVFLEVRIPYQETDAPGPPDRKSYYPAWIDAKSCGDSSYDLEPGKNIKEGVVALKYPGLLLGVGGHMHDYAERIVLEDVSRKETVAALDAKVDSQGRLLGMPTVIFFDKGGYKLAAGDVLKTSATYDNPTGKLLRDGAMGIVVGYFVPDDDTQMASLRRKAKPASRQTAAITHDR